MPERTSSMLVLASYFKGERFLEQAHRRGARLYLLTQAKLLDRPWPRHAIAEVLAQPDGSSLEHTLNTVSYLARTRVFESVVPLDDYDVEVAAALREHLRIPGMGETTARYFRDKLATRTRAQADGIAVPPFVHVLNHDALREFMARVPPPWMFKPRSEASAAGIVKVESAEQLWPLMESKGDRQSHYLLEKYLPGDVFHVDSIVAKGEPIFMEVHRCLTPPFDVAHGGGVYCSRTVDRGSTEDEALRRLNAQVLKSMGLLRGVSHVEFIQARADGQFSLLETAARVGGAHIADLIEASTGVNLWEEWANLEVDAGRVPYVLPPRRAEYGAVLITLARQERPDLGAYADPEVVLRADEPHHAGLVLRSPDPGRLSSLVQSYQGRMARDFTAILPSADRPQH